MCTILFAYRQHPEYELIIAANRDEEYERPSTAAHFWDDHPELLAGRDEVQWGTWLGIMKSGRFAALTNYRYGLGDDPTKLSRGQLVKDFLISEDSPGEFSRQIQDRKEEYNGFNLLAGDLNALFYYSGQQNEPRHLEPGIYGLSNALLDTPWPKVGNGKKKLKKIIEEHPNEVPQEALFDLLANRETAEDAQLPNTGIGLEKERLVSSLFIESPDYGTISSAVLTIDRQGKVSFAERTFQQGQASGNVSYSFQIQQGRS